MGPEAETGDRWPVRGRAHAGTPKGVRKPGRGKAQGSSGPPSLCGRVRLAAVKNPGAAEDVPWPAARTSYSSRRPAPRTKSIEASVPETAGGVFEAKASMNRGQDQGCEGSNPMSAAGVGRTRTRQGCASPRELAWHVARRTPQRMTGSGAFNSADVGRPFGRHCGEIRVGETRTAERKRKPARAAGTPKRECPEAGCPGQRDAAEDAEGDRTSGEAPGRPAVGSGQMAGAAASDEPGPAVSEGLTAAAQGAAQAGR
jgi:hypothetical protein